MALACDRHAVTPVDGGAAETRYNLLPVPGMCAAVDSPPLALDAVTTLGFAARDVLPWLTVQHDAELTWQSGTPGTLGCLVTPQGSSRVHLLVTPHTGAITMGRMLDGHGDGTQCRPVVSIPCQLSIWSDDGGINERREALIALPASDEGRFWVHLPPWGGGTVSAGTMAVTCDANATWISELTLIELAGTITPDATTGGATFHGSMPGIVSIAVPVAAWGPHPADAGVD